MTTAASNIGAKDELSFGDQVVKMFNSDRCDKRLFCDVTIQAREKRFAVHRAMLGLRSKFFEKLFTSEMKEKFAAVVKIDMDDDRLERILDYAYTGVVDFSGGNATDILDDAEYTELLDLKTECETYMFESVDVDNCLKLRSYALRYNLTQVADKSNRVIEDNFAEIVQQEDFKQLKVDEMSAIIKRERVKFQGEEVYTGITQWVKHNPTDRRELFAQLFLQLDLASFSSDYLRAAAKEDLVREEVQCSNALLDTTMQCYISHKDSNTQVDFLTIGGEGAAKLFVKHHVRSGIIEIMPQLNVNRIASTSVKCGNKVIIFGGADGTNQGAKATQKCEILDIASGTNWIPAADMPEARKFSASSILDGIIYVTGGQDLNNKSLSTIAMYDINLDSWSKGPDMLFRRCVHAMVNFNGTLYCLGGFDDKDLNTCERYTNNRWTAVAPMIEKRRGLSAVVFKRWIYAIGGYIVSKDLASVERYDPKVDQWSQVRTMNEARFCPRAFVTHGKIYVVGGMSKKSVEVYHEQVDTWTTCFDMQAIKNFCNVLAI